jgi:transcriptional regulator with XRE-family HTH domain
MTATGDPGTLATYLRARRQLVRPAVVGIADTGNRRVPGLRREEVAFLAGVSSDYYIRLEQGRDRHPSEQVLLSIAHALQLDEEATAYLLKLAASRRSRPRRPRKPEKVPDGIRSLITTWPLTPAYVHGTYMDVLAANHLAIALSPYNAPGHNSILTAFLEPEVRALHADWEEMTARVVPYLRSITGPDVDDPRLVDIVGELSVRSERFRHLWGRQDVKNKSSGVSLMRHPEVGPLELNYEKLMIPGAPGQILVTYHAQPGSTSEERLRLLASLSSPLHPHHDTPHTPADR